MKFTWDKELPEKTKREWTVWLKTLPEAIWIPRSFTKINQKIKEIEIHGFGDASKVGCCSTIYLVVVVHHDKGTSVNLLTAKSRISKRGTSIPRLELIAGHMVANSLDNVRNALQRYPVVSTYGWLDSTVALYWIANNNKEWKQFISNRVVKINQKKDITWRHCPTQDNSADIGSRGSSTLAPVWFKGPSWLTTKEDWPENIVKPNLTEVNDERKLVKQINLTTLTATVQECPINQLLLKHNLRRVTRIVGWLKRFVNNSRCETKLSGVPSSEEIQQAMTSLIKYSQQSITETKKFNDSKERLMLQLNESGVLV